MRSKAVFLVVCACLALAACNSDDAPGDAPAGQGGAAGTATGGAGGTGATAGAAGTAGAGGATAGTGGSTAGTGAGAGGTTGGAGAGAGGDAGMTGGAGAGAGGSGGTVESDAEVPGGTGPFPPVSDFAAMGPYMSKTVSGVGPNSNYTLYIPTELAPGGAKNPIVGWMSGGATDHTWYTLLPHLATHGFVVVASNTVPSIGAEAALGEEIIAGIEWAIAENARAGSEYEGKLDITKIASVGYSMGSLATFTIAMDERLTTTVHISGGNMVPERINNLRKPAAFICGIPGDASCGLLDTACDIAATNCNTDFESATTPVFYATFQSGHLGIMTSPYMERIAGMTTEWLRYYLMSDTTCKDSFVGDACKYCADTASWTVKQKNLEE
jgi:hypothetical protein